LTRRTLLIAGAVAIAFVVGIVAGGQVGAIRDAVDDVFGNQGQDATAQAINLIHDDYFHTVDDNDLENASIGSIIDHIKKRYGDRFSHYFTPTEYDRFRQGSSLSGVGIAVNEVGRGLRVATVYKHTPARNAGIQAGEVITAVNGSPIAGKDVDTVTSQIRGPAGTKVTLTVASRDGKSRDVTLTRREVNIPQVVGHIETVNGVKLGYVRLAGFFPGAHGELRSEIEKLDRRGVLVDPAADPERALAGEQELDRVARLLKDVSPRACQVFVAQRGGYSYEEIAAAYSLKPRTVEKHVATAALVLAEMMPADFAAP